MIRLSVNVNKIATLRNARGGNNPDLLKMTADIERFGAQGITVHPRPDERHIRYSDVVALKPLVSTEFNIEGYPSDDFIELVSAVKPTQVTLVPDPPNVLTSNAGWDTIKHHEFLTGVISDLKRKGIRTSLFIDPIESLIESAASTGTDRIELYTEAYAHGFKIDKAKAIAPYQSAAKLALQLGMGVNAGHDLDLQNLRYFAQNIPELEEVSIGHALICDALYLGIENTVRLYLRELEI
jgi:pyridoxine 5-phosphate synthase